MRNRMAYFMGSMFESEASSLKKDFFESLSDSLNQYEGMRSNATLDVYAGPSPRDIMPQPPQLETQDADGPLDEDALWEMLQNAPGAVPQEGEEADAMWEADQRRWWQAPLDKMVLESNAEADRPDKLSAEQLLAGMEQLPGYVAHHAGVQGLFARVLRDALEDLHGYAQPPRTGCAADMMEINGNAFRLLIEVTEQPQPLQSKAAARLFINER